jgi:hypothetical protein
MVGGVPDNFWSISADGVFDVVFVNSAFRLSHQFVAGLHIPAVIDGVVQLRKHTPEPIHYQSSVGDNPIAL